MLGHFGWQLDTPFSSNFFRRGSQLIDYAVAGELLQESLAKSNRSFVDGQVPHASDSSCNEDIIRIFSSATQAYREVLLGCLLARRLDKQIDIRKPYVNLGYNAFNGRTLDERVVNPALQAARVPCSRGPYLSVFRRSVTFDSTTGHRDVAACEAFLRLLTVAEQLTDDEQLQELIDLLLYQFVKLREESNIELNRLQRFSLIQQQSLINCLLSSPSGGRFPLYVVVALLKACKTRFRLDWSISFQGINVSDKSSGVTGDITVTSGGELLFAAEVTERQVDDHRVTSTFNVKVGPSGAKDYVFLITEPPTAKAIQQAHRYFSQGHEISFVEIPTWSLGMLATIGQQGRESFNQELLGLLGLADTPKTMRVSWNACVERVISAT